jgi:mono/diheme cytochrome c family protein
MNCDFLYPGGVNDNQLRAWNHVGLFESRLDENDLGSHAKLAPADDNSRSLEDRARSYLDANCAQCHRPGGTVAYFDARYDTPLARQGLIDGQILINEGLDNARVIAPNDRWRSVAFLRMSTLEALKMPPIAHQRLDSEGLGLVQRWIESLPGPSVLEPPMITPAAGHYAGAVEVTLTEKEPGAAIRYTLDGSAPAKSDPIYEHPIKLTEPTVLRAKAFKPGFTKSITVQGVFMVGD